MLNYLDLFLLIILAWGAWRGYRMGFVNLVTGWVSYLVAGLAALIYARPLVDIIDQAWHLSRRWGEGLIPFIPLPGPVLSQPADAGAARQLEVLLGGMPLPGPIKQSLLAAAGKINSLSLGQALAGQIVFLGLELIVMVTIFLGCLFLLRRLARWSTRGIHMSPLGLFSRVLGLTLSLLGQAFWLALLVGLLRSLLALPATTVLPGFLPLARQLFNSGVAMQLGNFYDWLAGLLHTLI